MAHALTRANGKYEMAYVGETPWHGLGQVLQPTADIETWQKAAGMDWIICSAPIQFDGSRDGSNLRTWGDKRVLFRGDNLNPLGVVGSNYQIVQPYEMLEFFRDLVEGNGFQLETAGTLFGGARFWALAKVTEATIAGWDRIGSYVLISSTADGSRATEVRETTVRVVCNNTLSAALRASEKANIVIRHNTVFDVESTQKKLGLSRDHFASFIEVANTLTKVRVSEAAAVMFVTKLLSKPVADEEQTPAEAVRLPRGFNRIMELFSGQGMGSTQKGSESTAWGLLNAVTQYVDHESTAKSVDHRIDKAFWGAGDVLKTKALELAQQL